MTVVVSPVALDFLWESLSAGEPPYPLRVLSHGATMDERAALRQEVLAAQNTEDLREQLAILANATETVDSVFEGNAMLAATDGTKALLATQTGEGLSLREIDPMSATSEVVAALPAHPRGTERSITIPETDLQQLAAARPAGPSATDSQVLAALSAQPKLRAGQLAVNTRSAMGTRTRSPVLSWFDTPTGRYLTYTKNAWITIAPADAPTLRHRLTELLQALKSPAR